MPDPRVLKMLRLIDAKLDAVASTHRKDMLELDEEQEQQNSRLSKHDERLAKHADCLAEHERRIKRLENARARK